MAIEDLLQGILGSALGQSGSGQQGGGLQDILGSILGGGAAQQQGGALPSQGGSLEDILGGLGQQQGDALPSQGGGLGDILGSILGGGAAQQQGGALPSQAGGLGDILGSILGGGSAGSSGLGGILGGILGGSSGMANNAILAPITQAVADRLGVSPAIAQAIVLFAVTTVIPALLKGLQRKSGGALPSQASPMPVGDSAQGGLDLDDLLNQMGSHRAIGSDYLRSTGLTQQLSDQTGLDEGMATEGLQQALYMLGQYLDEGDEAAGPSQEGGTGDMKDLLDTWGRS